MNGSITRTLVLFLTTVTFSCGKDAPMEKDGTPILSISASAPNMELDKRGDWILTVGTQEYSKTFSFDTMTGVPAASPYILENLEDNGNASIGLSLVSPSFLTTNAALIRNVYATSPIIPRIESMADQSTAEKIFNSDVLMAYATLKPSSNIKGLALKHAHVLVDFETIDIPANAVIKVNHSVSTTPYHYKTGHFKAITAFLAPQITVTIDAREYSVTPLMNQNGVFSNNIYKFEIKFDDVSKKLTAQNVTAQDWGEVKEWYK